MTHYQVFLTVEPLEDHHRGVFSAVTASGEGARLACFLPLFCVILMCRGTPAGWNKRRTQADLIHFGSKFTSLTERVWKQRSTNVSTYTNGTADEWAKHKEGHICRDMILLSQFI